MNNIFVRNVRNVINRKIINFTNRKYHFITKTDDVFRILDKNNNVLSKNQILENNKLSYYSQFGLSLYNFNEIGEVVYKEKYSNINDRIEKDEIYLEVETVKSCNEMLSPIGGLINKYNEDFMENINNIEDIKLLDESTRYEFMDKHNLYFVSVILSENDIYEFIKNINDYDYNNE